MEHEEFTLEDVIANNIYISLMGMKWLPGDIKTKVQNNFLTFLEFLLFDIIIMYEMDKLKMREEIDSIEVYLIIQAGLQKLKGMKDELLDGDLIVDEIKALEEIIAERI